MKKEELLLKLANALGANGDPEQSHSMADEALIEFIGDKEVKNIYDKITKWYA